MLDQKYILLIMNCKKYIKKAKFQRMTWLRDIPSYLIYYHVIGEPNLESDYKFDHESKILWIKVEDDYNSLPKKVIRAYNAVSQTFCFNYIFKTDDDQILVNKNYFNILIEILNKRPNIHYGGFVVDIKHNHFSDYHKLHPELPPNLPLFKTKYCSGRFYFLSNYSVGYLLKKQDEIENEYFEDYAIGFHLNETYKDNMLYLSTNKFFTDIELSDFPAMLKEGKI